MADEKLDVVQVAEECPSVEASTHEAASCPPSGSTSAATVYTDLLPGFGVAFDTALDAFAMGLALWGDDNPDKLAEQVFRVASALAKERGEDDILHMESVIDYMNKSPSLRCTRLHVHFILVCVDLYISRCCPDKALQACVCAQKIAAAHSEMEHLEMEACKKLMNVYLNLGQPQMVHTAYMDFLRVMKRRLSSTSATSRLEFDDLRDAGRVCIAVGRVDDGLDYLVEALRTEGEEGESNPVSTAKQATALLALSEGYLWTNHSFSQQAALLVVEQAIAGFQQASCTCFIAIHDNTDWGGTRRFPCPLHQIQSHALELQGNTQRMQGNLVEAEKSYQQGLSLVQECNGDVRAADFHLLLSGLYHSMSSDNVEFGLYREEYKYINDHNIKLGERIAYHDAEFGKASKPGASFYHDQVALFYRELPQSLEEYFGNGGAPPQVRTIQKMLAASEERKSLDSHALLFSAISTHYARVGDFESCKGNFFRALEYLKTVPTSACNTSTRQALGQVALEQGVLELDIAYELWLEVIREAEEKLQSLARVSEEHALHYFELSKHATMAMAKCQMFRSRAASQSASREMAHVYAASALAWAERGKGRMLMSHLAATQRAEESKSRTHDGGSTCVLNPSLRSPVDFESQFLSNDAYALDFIMNKRAPSLLRAAKTVFVEYTFVDYMHLLVHIIIDGSAKIHGAGIFPLTEKLDTHTRREAEKELGSVQERSRTHVIAESPACANDLEEGSTIKPRQTGAEDESAAKVLLAMDKYATNRVPFNPWIPGIVAGIQRRAIEAQTKRKRRQNVDNEERKIRSLLQSLYTALIQPIKHKLSELCSPGDTVVFVPHEDLGVVPFAALHESDFRPACLIEEFAIFVSPSIWSSRHCQNLYEEKVHARSSEGAPVLVGRQSGYPPGWKPLSLAHEEVKVIAETLGSTSVQVLDNTPQLSAHMKERAMEALPEASWIHLCMHGEISPQYPQGSLLLGDSDSQRLTATEIISSATSPWRARAAIASACQTGLGSVAGGGIQGFAKSFILAGVPSCVLALWEVDERFCTVFMGELYGSLRAGVDLAQAMRAATLSMMQQRKSPKHIKKPSRLNVAPVLEPAWSILDWAAFSGFGYAGVAFPNVAAESRNVD